MKIQKKSISIIILLIILVLVRLDNRVIAYPPPEFVPDIHYPITSEYYQNIFNLDTEISEIVIRYRMGTAPSLINAREQALILSSKVDYEGDFYRNKNLDEIEYYIGYYDDFNISQFYSAGYSNEEIKPIFQLIMNDITYFCNGEEYGDDDFLKFVTPWELGIEFKSYVMVTFYPADRDYYIHCPVNSIIKGWHPADDPPVELLPLINFFENEIIPIAREHPY